MFSLSFFAVVVLFLLVLVIACFVMFVYFKIIGSYANNFVYISTSVSKLTAKDICNNYAILALGNRV